MNDQTAAPERMPPPATLDELLGRARGIAGLTLGEVARRVGVALPEDLRRHKGAVGVLVERALGATAGSAGRPDFEALGVELKTVPVLRSGQPTESTFVCTAPLHAIADTEWAESPVRRKLACVLWVPVEAEPTVRLATRRVGAPLVWRPTDEELDLLAADWAELAGQLALGEGEALTAHVGRWLQVRPKAANAGARRRAADRDGVRADAAPRGFYLRRAFTARLLARAGLVHDARVDGLGARPPA